MALAKFRKQRGQAAPKHVALEDVELDERWTDLWTAFLDLKGSAGIGMAPEPVSPADVLAWCQLHEVPSWRWRTFWAVVHHLDRKSRDFTRTKRDDNPEAGD